MPGILQASGIIQRLFHRGYSTRPTTAGTVTIALISPPALLGPPNTRISVKSTLALSMQHGRPFSRPSHPWPPKRMLLYPEAQNPPTPGHTQSSDPSAGFWTRTHTGESPCHLPQAQVPSHPQPRCTTPCSQSMWLGLDLVSHGRWTSCFSHPPPPPTQCRLLVGSGWEQD